MSLGYVLVAIKYLLMSQPTVTPSTMYLILHNKWDTVYFFLQLRNYFPAVFSEGCAKRYATS